VDDSTWTGTSTADDAGRRWCNTGLLLRMPTSWYPPEKLSNLQRNRLRDQRSQWVLHPEREPYGTTTKPHSLGIYIRCTRVRHRRYSYSVASAGLDKHLLATGHPTQKVIVKATLTDNDARENGPLPPTSVITHPAVPDGRSVWSAYQAQGSSDYIMQDAADAQMDYEMESSSGYDSPVRIHLAILHLRPVERASLPEIEKEDSTPCRTSTSSYLRKLDLRPLRREPDRHRRQHPDSFSAVSTHSG
jgi:hypothetical protein